MHYNNTYIPDPHPSHPRNSSKLKNSSIPSNSDYHPPPPLNAVDSAWMNKVAMHTQYLSAGSNNNNNNIEGGSGGVAD